MDLGRLDLHQGDHTAALALLDLHHPGEQRVARVDEVVAEEHREGLLTDVGRGAQHGVAQALGVALAHIVHGGEVAGLPDLGEPGLVALAGEGLLQLVVAVEVVLQGTLVASRDHQYVGETGGDRLLDHVLDRGLVDDRQHLLGRGLGGRQEPGAEACRRNDSLGDPCGRLSHAQHTNRCVWAEDYPPVNSLS